MSAEMDLDKNVEKECKKVAVPAKSDYKKMALFDALISPEFDCKLDIFVRLFEQYVPIIDHVIPSTSIFKIDETNYRAGNTLLHVAKVYDELKLFDILIQHGADFTLKDNNGSPMLKLTAKHEYNNYFEMKVGGYLPDKKFIDKILSAHIEYENINNPSNENGISHFHFACMNNKPEVVEFFLNNGVSVSESVHTDSPIYAGYTPLHFAVKYCAVETVQILLKYGADPQMKDSKGLNPLHVLIDEKINTWSQITRRQRAFGNEDYSGLKKFHQKIEKIITILLEKDSCWDSNLYDDTGLSYLHVISTMQNSSDVVKFLDDRQVDLNQKMNANSTLWPGYTAIHFAAHFKADTVRFLMHRGADLASKDASGTTPFDICLNGMELLDIHSFLYLNSDLSDIRFSDGTTKLSDFLLSMRSIQEFIKFLKYKVEDANMFIPFDSPICAGYTPLHLCMICSEIPRNFHPENVDHNLPSSQLFSYKSRILQCRIKEVNLYATDSRGRTPIHWAFDLQETYQAMDLLMCRSQVNIPNVVDDRGLSILHIACAAYRETAVEQLLSKGANVNEATKSSHALYEFFSVCSKSKALLQPFAVGSTPLHIAVIVECPEIVELLIGRDADVFAEDVDALTPLERCLGKSVFGKTKIPSWKIRSSPLSDRQIRISELLILRASQLSADTRSDRMLYCYSLLSAETLDKLLSNVNEPMKKILKSAGITMLHVACFLKDPQQVEEQLLQAEANVNARVDLTSPLWSGCTPLHILMNLGKKQTNCDVAEHLKIVILLLRFGADVAATDDLGSTLLHSVFQSYLDNNANHFFLDMFLHHITDFSVNPTNAKGLSHLHAACARNNAAVVRKFMEHDADTEQAVDYFDHKYGGFAALHFAAAFRSEKVVDILLSYGADVQREDVFDRTPLHVAAEGRGQASVQIFRSLFGAGAKMNARNVFGERPLEKLLRNNRATNEEIAVFLEHNCSINKWNPMTNEGCLAIALEIDHAPIFQTVIQAVDIKKIRSNGRNAIHNIVSINDRDWDYYDEDDPIEEIFIPVNNYTVAIETLMELGLNINHQDNRGFTPLHEAASRSNVTGIVGLLNNGANINLVNSNGESAFALSLRISKLTGGMGKIEEEIFTFISAYMYKLNLIGAEISKSNLEVWLEINKIISLNDTWYHECCNEFERMKSLNIGGYSVTLEDFLSDTSAVSSYPFMLSDKRNAINKFFESESSTFELEFPKFNKFLILQYKKAKARLHLIMPAEKSINYHFGFTVPPICSRIIIRFLNNEQLNNLILSAVEY